jgi:hypothetical protein
MPGVYKEKECPSCFKLHRKKGAYCSISCSNAARSLTDQTKEKIADGMREYYNTPEGIAQASINNRRVLADKMGAPLPVTIDEFVVDIPTIYELPDGYTTDF